MEISKINNVSFGCLHKNTNEFDIKPNRPSHTGRNALIFLGLAATGAVAAAILLKKNKLPNFEFGKKLTNIDTNKAQSQLQPKVQLEVPVQEKAIEKTVEKAVPQPIVVEKQPTIIPENVQESTAVVSDGMQAVSEKRPTIKVVEIADEKEAQAVVQNDKLTLEKEPTAEVIEKQPEQAQNVETTKPQRRRRAEKFDLETRANNSRINQPYLDEVIANSNRFATFGVEPKFLEALEEVNPEMVKLMDNDFLSIVLAPKEKISIDFYEAMHLNKSKNRVSSFVNDSISKITKNPSKKDLKAKQYRVFQAVPNVNSDEARIDKIRKLDSTFEVEDIKKVFEADSNIRKDALLNWLMGFNGAQKDQSLVESIVRV